MDYRTHDGIQSGVSQRSSLYFSLALQTFGSGVKPRYGAAPSFK
jgi:hypothetical protein